MTDAILPTLLISGSVILGSVITSILKIKSKTECMVLILSAFNEIECMHEVDVKIEEAVEDFNVNCLLQVLGNACFLAEKADHAEPP